MFWWGRVNALIFFSTLAIAAWMAFTGDWAAFFGAFIAAFLVRLLLGFINLAVTAVTGTPLFYDTKLIDRRRGRGGDDA